MNTEVIAKERFEIKLSHDDLSELTALAKLDKRSTKNYVELIVEKHLQKIRNKKQKQ